VRALAGLDKVLPKPFVNPGSEPCVSNPTVLGVRAVYQFGSGVGPSVAAAPDSANLESIVNLSAASLAANGLTASTTVGQWRAMQVQKLGSDAYQTVLSGGQ